uniref:Trichome birefringence-like C-terminal domain-containing protein n=1 Tax=Aegilops tauschii TaxID=37682 RepID=N1QXI9_AEGTA
MQQRRKSVFGSAPYAMKQAALGAGVAARKNGTPLSMAAVVFSLFVFATFLYNEDIKSIADFPFGAGAGALRAKSPDLHLLQEAEAAAPPAKWRWQPTDCDLPRFDARLLLERLRNKRLMFVGDSLNRNQWESMVCLVQSVIPKGHKTLTKFVNNGSSNVFYAHDYNATVEFYWAPFLVESNSDNPKVHSVPDRVIQWHSIAKHAKNWVSVDYLVFNTYIWWLSALDMKVLKKGSFDEGATEYEEVDRPVAYSEVLKTWAKWVDRNIDPNSTTVFFMGMSPNHITPEAWGNEGGIKCAMETQPIANRSATLDVGTDWRLYAGAQDVLKTFRRVPVHFVDITALSELRKDAHTSVHTLRQGKLLTPEQQANPKTYADCIHWCLPGLPDTWNQFLYARIVSSASTQRQE